MSWYFLALSLLGAFLTYNVYRPYRRSTVAAALSFLVGWLYGDLAPWVIALQLVGTGLFIYAGAGETLLGLAALMITIASWLALAIRFGRGLDYGVITEQALAITLGADFQNEIAAETLARIPNRFPKRRYLAPFSPRLPGVSCHRDIVVHKYDTADVSIDIYHAEGGVDNAPVLYQIHGGGWTENFGDKTNQALPLMNHMAALGWVCVTVDYRLSPTHVWPAHIVDCKEALAWIKENIADYGGNPDFVITTGGSAGGHLCSLLALTANDPHFQPGFEDIDTSVRACVPYYGVYDFSDASKLHLNPGLIEMLQLSVLNKPLDEHQDLFRAASPMHRVHADAPPFFVIHGTHDSLTSLREAQEFVRRLREQSKQTTAYLEVPGAQHAFDLFANPRADWTMRAVMLFLCHQYALYEQQQPSL